MNKIDHIIYRADQNFTDMQIVRGSANAPIAAHFDDLWENKPNRSARMLRLFLAWLARQPGAQLPRRAERGAASLLFAAGCAPVAFIFLAVIIWLCTGFIPGANY